MATFARATFNAASYASYRPTYPQSLYNIIYAFHAKPHGQFDTALDLGCGTGQVSSELVKFQHVVGVDPGAGMIEKAKEAQSKPNYKGRKVEYVQGAAEKLPFIEDSSIDLVVAGQAAHWFDFSKLWPELGRVVRPGGSVAMWGHSEFRLPKHLSLTARIHEYSKDNHLVDIPPPPSSLFSDYEVQQYTAPHHPELGNEQPVIMQQTMPWAALRGWLDTSSALHAFREKYPDEPDPADQVYADLREGAAREGAQVGEDDMVVVDRPLSIILAKRNS